MTEMASLLKIDRKTCRRWLKKEGLTPIEKNVNPILVMGANLTDFLNKKRAKRRIRLADDEFYCLKCHKSVRAKMGSEKIVKTGKRIGKNDLEQLKKTGLCKICDTEVNRFLRGDRQN
jgi:hypothetical protein